MTSPLPGRAASRRHDRTGRRRGSRPPGGRGSRSGAGRRVSILRGAPGVRRGVARLGGERARRLIAMRGGGPAGGPGRLACRAAPGAAGRGRPIGRCPMGAAFRHRYDLWHSKRWPSRGLMALSHRRRSPGPLGYSGRRLGPASFPMMEPNSPAEDLPALYRAILDRVAELEASGERGAAAQVRTTAIRAYSRAWDDRARRELEQLLRRGATPTAAERLLKRGTRSRRPGSPMVRRRSRGPVAPQR